MNNNNFTTPNRFNQAQSNTGLNQLNNNSNSNLTIFGSSGHAAGNNGAAVGGGGGGGGSNNSLNHLSSNSRSNIKLPPTIPNYNRNLNMSISGVSVGRI
jgi:hypothetical protein